ncbi:MAG: M20/M25/M40 family metallo-hydrolase [Pseudomonadales bacterium]
MKSAFIDALWEQRFIPALVDYIGIPNKSPAFDPDWHAHGYMHAAAQRLASECRALPGITGLQVDIVELPGRTPTLVLEIPAFADGAGNVLIYGHYDKQPEFSGWRAGLSPWIAVQDGDRLYGRGGADDGYAIFAALAAIASLQHHGVPHGRCLILIEGCEESGSFDLPAYTAALADRIGTPDLLVCLDAECGDYERLWTTTSLRGLLPGVLSVTVLEEGQHSGAAGGIVPSSFRLLRLLLDRVENAADGSLHACLQSTIPDAERRRIRDVATLLGNAATQRFPWAGNTQPDHTDPFDALLANAWSPSLAVTGLGGAPDPAHAGNTLRPSTRAKLVFRLPPNRDAHDAAECVRTLLEADPPNGAVVEFAVETPQTGWHASVRAAWLEAALDRASISHFGWPAMAMGMGGTIPFLRMLADAFPTTPFMVTGVLGPASNAHGPNEFLHVPTAKRLSACVADVIAELARQHAS